MPSVTGTEVAPGGAVHASARVAIRLVASTEGEAAGYSTSGNVSIDGVTSVVTNSSGVWTATLVANSLITPANTVYVADVRPAVGRPIRHTFSVPNGAGPYRVEDILADPPAALASSAAVARIGDTMTGPLRFNPAASAADWTAFAFDTTFESGLYTDHVMMFGFNLGASDAVQDAAQAAIWFQMESKFRNGSGSPYGSEWHVNFLRPNTAFGTQKRPFNMFMEHASDLMYFESDGQWEFWDSARTSQRMVLDFNGANRAVRLVNNTILWTTSSNALPATGADSLLIMERAGGGIADQIFRVTADGILTIGPAYAQAGGGKDGIVVLSNAGTVPSSNPTGAGILYAQAGALKWRGSSGTVTTIAAA